MYGTSVAAVEDVGKGKKTCILDIDTQVSLHATTLYYRSRSTALIHLFDQGVKLIKTNHPSLNPLYVFISPPSLSSLRTRLTGRGTESDSSMKARLDAAIGEVEYAKTGAFDIVVVNDDLERCYSVLRKVLVEGQTTGDVLPSFEGTTG